MSKPSSCVGCSIFDTGKGFVPASGPINAKLLFVGEAPGENEAIESLPFVGASGQLLNRVLNFCGIKREEIRIHNILSCSPKNNFLVGAPWEDSSISHCSQYINKTLDEDHKVIVALGATAAKRLTGLHNTKGVKMEDLHGAPIRDITGKYWVIATYHPSFVLQGNWKYFGVLIHDILRAKNIAENGHIQDNPNLICDPPWHIFDEWTRNVIKRAEGTEDGLWIAVDIETPKKNKVDEDKLIERNEEGDILQEPNSEVITDNIIRINFAVDINEGVTVPFGETYLPSIISLLQNPKLKKGFWNMVFDRSRLEAAGLLVAEPCFDFMWCWHLLQSDIRMSLGFVAPFFSMHSPWKHLTDHRKPIHNYTLEDFTNFQKYSALDAVQTIRCIYGIEKDLKALGGWYAFERHIRDIDRYAFRPAEEVGLLVNKDELSKFEKELIIKQDEIVDICIKNAPQEIVPYEKEWRTSRPATDENGNLLPGCKEIFMKSMGYICGNCGTEDVNKVHNKTKKCKNANLRFEELEIKRWVKEGMFNPNSPNQILSYIKYRGHKPGRAKKTGADTSNAAALDALAKKHPKDPIYRQLLILRKVSKIKGTYATGMLEKLDKDNRLHTYLSHKPSTLRSASSAPNLQNVVNVKTGDEDNYGSRIRECIIASPGCTLIEADFSAIEAVTTGWCARDKDYIRLAKLGIHDYLTSYLVNNPTNLNWDDNKIREHHSYIKKEHKLLRERSKRAIHGSSYGLTALGLHLTYPEDFSSIRVAKETQEVFFKVAPKVRSWQLDTIKKADQQHYLGGKDHPFGYKHWFWNVMNYTKLDSYSKSMYRKSKGAQVKTDGKGTWWEIKHGDDAKRALAFFPQSIAGGILKEAMLLLFDPSSNLYIGDTYFGKTPLRMPIHDALLLEVPDDKIDYVLERMLIAMRSPIKQLPLPPEWGMGEFLTVGTETEMGKVWNQMKKVDI